MNPDTAAGMEGRTRARCPPSPSPVLPEQGVVRPDQTSVPRNTYWSPNGGARTQKRNKVEHSGFGFGWKKWAFREGPGPLKSKISPKLLWYKIHIDGKSLGVNELSGTDPGFWPETKDDFELLTEFAVSTTQETAMEEPQTKLEVFWASAVLNLEHLVPDSLLDPHLSIVWLLVLFCAGMCVVEEAIKALKALKALKAKGTRAVPSGPAGTLLKATRGHHQARIQDRGPGGDPLEPSRKAAGLILWKFSGKTPTSVNEPFGCLALFSILFWKVRGYEGNHQGQRASGHGTGPLVVGFHVWTQFWHHSIWAKVHDSCKCQRWIRVHTWRLVPRTSSQM